MQDSNSPFNPTEPTQEPMQPSAQEPTQTPTQGITQPPVQESPQNTAQSSTQEPPQDMSQQFPVQEQAQEPDQTPPQNTTITQPFPAAQESTTTVTTATAKTLVLSGKLIAIIAGAILLAGGAAAFFVFILPNTTSNNNSGGKGGNKNVSINGYNGEELYDMISAEHAYNQHYPIPVYSENRKHCHYVDFESGKAINDKEYEYCSDFDQNGYAIISDEYHDSYLIDANGKNVHKNVQYVTAEGNYSTWDNGESWKIQKEYYLIDKDFKRVSEEGWEIVEDRVLSYFERGVSDKLSYVLAQKGDRYAFRDASGKYIEIDDFKGRTISDEEYIDFTFTKSEYEDNYYCAVAFPGYVTVHNCATGELIDDITEEIGAKGKEARVVTPDDVNMVFYAYIYDDEDNVIDDRANSNLFYYFDNKRVYKISNFDGSNSMGIGSYPGDVLHIAYNNRYTYYQVDPFSGEMTSESGHIGAISSGRFNPNAYGVNEASEYTFRTYPKLNLAVNTIGNVYFNGSKIEIDDNSKFSVSLDKSAMLYLASQGRVPIIADYKVYNALNKQKLGNIENANGSIAVGGESIFYATDAKDNNNHKVIYNLANDKSTEIELHDEYSAYSYHDYYFVLEDIQGENIYYNADMKEVARTKK